VTPIGYLQSVAARKALEVEQLRCAGGALPAKAEQLPPARDLRSALRGGAVVAEVKRRSPSGGELRSGLDPAAAATAYAAAGAAAVSVLTDATDFGGSLDDLAAARSAVDVPLLRKDFTVDALQIAEARVAGGDWVLLIAALLDDAALDACLEAATRFGAHAVVEAHSADEARRAVAAGAECVGINNRDLRTLTTDLGTFARIRPAIPDGVVCIAESGVRSADDVRMLVEAGADAVLVGEALSRADDAARLCAQLVAAGRAAARA